MNYQDVLLKMALVGSATLWYCSMSAQGVKQLRQPPVIAEKIKSLNIGDKVPDLAINNIINFPRSTARFSDFRNRLVLIDFWGTTCSSCILALPKIDTLQKVFGDKIQVLTVTGYDSKEQVIKTLQRLPRTRNLQLPVVLNNTELKKLFPHELVSHVIWIDGQGIVKAITGTEYITAANIQQVLDGKLVNWPVKTDRVGFEYDKPLLQFNHGTAPPPFLYYSALMGHLAGIDATDVTGIDSTNKTITRNHFNMTLLQLCDGSLNGQGTGYIDPKKLILQVKDPGRYVAFNEYQAIWRQQNTYCYSITLPLSLPEEETRKIIRNDLTHWLQVKGITVKKEVRTMPCLVLVRTKKDDGLLQSKGGDPVYTLTDPGSVKRLTNTLFSALIFHLNEETPGIPWVVDETGIPGEMKVDMTFNLGSFQDLDAVRSSLQPYGLDLLKAERPLEMYVITEQPTSPH